MQENETRTLLDMLRTMSKEKKSKRKEHLQPMIHAYNCTCHETTTSLEYIEELHSKLTELQDLTELRPEKTQRRTVSGRSERLQFKEEMQS